MLRTPDPGRSFLWLYKTSLVLLPAFLLGVLLIDGCKKTDVASSSSSSGSIVSSLPASITAVGKPVGTPVTKTIGPAGGSLVSANGVVEIKIPAGALASNTAISIQPVMNAMPGALDTLAYDLLPNGTKFSVPATITFHYTADQLPDNRAEFLFVAFQDSSREWAADAKQRDYDTTAKTVSLDISHFTVYSVGDEFTIKATRLSLKEYETSALTVHETYFEDKDGNPKLVQDNIVDGKYLTGWDVNNTPNGNATLGTVTPNGPFAQYLSPASIPQAHTQTIGVHIGIKLAIFKKGKVVQNIDGFDRSIGIRIEPYHTYTLTVVLKIEDSTIAFAEYDPTKPKPVYTDIAIIHLQVEAKKKGPFAIFVDALNSPPTVSPASYKGPVTTWYWIPDSYGETNVTNVTTNNPDIFPPDSIVQFQVTNQNTFFPGFKYTFNTNGAQAGNPVQPTPFPIGLPDGFVIDFKVTDHSNADNFLYTYSDGDRGQWFYVTVFGH